MRSVLVTGATGFVGQHLLQRLRPIVDEIRAVSRSQNLCSTQDQSILCDLQYEAVPDQAVAGVDTVFHLAGVAHDLRNASVLEELYYLVNVKATEQLAKLAVSNGVKRFIFVSSVKAGGEAIHKDRCVTETDQGFPEGIYGETKRVAELKLLEIGQSSGMHVSIIRPALVYGTGVKGNMQKMMSAISAGWFPPLPETNNRRSMVHVEDLVSALLLVAGDEHANGEIYIATDGEHYSSRQIYNFMREAAGRKPAYWAVPNFLFCGAAWFGDRLGGRFPFNSYRYNKLLGNECYSSDKLQALGFMPSYSFQGAVSGMVAAMNNQGKA